jgi:ABC-2 type transport system ATP-binding protein
MPAMSARPPQRLEISALSAHAGGRDVLAGISLEVATGEIVAIVGPNGAGKTTLLECIVGLRPASGAVRLEGRELRTFGDRARILSYMPDELVLPHETSVALALGIEPRSALAAKLEITNLLAVRGSELSRGEQKRCQLCAALEPARPVVLLDEPLGAFDPRQLRSVIPLLREAAKTRAILLTVHQMRSAELVADRIVMLAGGRVIASGTVADLRARAGSSSSAFDDVFLALLDEAQP